MPKFAIALVVFFIGFFDVRITDCLGRLVFRNAKNQFMVDVDLSFQSNGLYFVNVISEDKKSRTLKILLQQ